MPDALKFELGDINEYPIDTGYSVKKGDLLGYAGTNPQTVRPLTAGDVFAGVSDDDYDPKKGSPTARFRCRGVLVGDVAGLTGAEAPGAAIYASDHATLTHVPTGNSYVGPLLRQSDGSGDASVQFGFGGSAPAGSSVGPVGGSLLAPVTKSNGAQFNATIAGAIAGNNTSGANTLDVGSFIKLRCSGRGFADASTTPQYNFGVMVDGAEIAGIEADFAFTPGGSPQNLHYDMQYEAVCVSRAGAIGTFIPTLRGDFTLINGVAVGSSWGDENSDGSFTLDLTAAHTWDMGIKITTGHTWETDAATLVSGKLF